MAGQAQPIDSQGAGLRGRVLLLTKTDFAVPRDGGTLRVHAVVRQLEASGYRVDSLAVRRSAVEASSHRSTAILHNPVPAVRALGAFLRTLSPSTIKWFSPALLGAALAAVRSTNYDLVVVEYTQLLPYAAALPGPVILDMHNIESELLANYAVSSGSRLEKLVGRYESARLRSLEAAASVNVDTIVTVSEHDAQIARGWGAHRSDRGANVVVAPNGVADEAFLRDEARTPTVVFVGQLGWKPNVDAAVWLVEEVWPLVVAQRPDLKLQLVGRSPAPTVLRLAQDGVEVHADVPSTLPAVGSATVATAPLLAAGGTRLKILEALACGTTVVSTPLGALGLEHLEGKYLRLAAEPESFAGHVLQAASEVVDRAGPRRIVEDYRWPTALRKFVDSVGSLVAD